MAQTIDFATVKEQHHALWGEYSKDEAKIVRDPEPFLKKLRDLLENMKTVSAHMTSVEDYVWLHEKVRSWRLLSSSSLNTPSDVTLLPPMQPLRPPRGEAELSLETTPEQWRVQKAQELFTRRLITRHYATSEQEIVRQELSKLGPEQRESEKLDDWFQSGIHLAAEVLDGRINFLRRFTRESYNLLEGPCWLDDVRRLKAHLMWRERDGGWGEEGMCRDYLDACERIRQKLVDPDVKLSQTASEPILEYIKTEYLTRRQDNTWGLNGGKTNNLIDVKAGRVWQLTRNTDEKMNWYYAEQYARDFYENIIPAVTGDAKKIEKVMDALQLRGDLTGPNLVNCFEVAVAIHCVDHGEIRKYLKLAQGAKAA